MTLDWLCKKSRELVARGHTTPASDLLEMYCGNGNHTMALASCGAFRKVLGIEINKVSCVSVSCTERMGECECGCRVRN